MSVLTCGGRAVDDHLQPVGPVCGTEFHGVAVTGWGLLGVAAAVTPDGVIGPAPAPPISDLRAQARAAGWALSDTTATCPACRRGQPSERTPA